MRGPETERLLQAVRAAVVEARRGGVTVRACIWDATVAAVDGESHTWPSKEARRTAEAACRAVDPPTVMADPTARPAGCSPAGEETVPNDLAEPADLRDRIAAAIWAQYPDAEPSRTGLVLANPHGLADAVLAVRDAELARLRAQVAAARAFAVEMRGYCSPHGISALYADRLDERLDAAAARLVVQPDADGPRR